VPHASALTNDSTENGDEDVSWTETSFVGLPSSHCLGNEQKPNLTDLMTQFLALDKCLPRRKHLQVLNISCPQGVDTNIDALLYDLEWLCILQKTHGWTVKSSNRFADPDFSTILVNDQDRENLLQRMRLNHPLVGPILAIPNNFVMTVLPHGSMGSDYSVNGGRMIGNPQTDMLLQTLGLNHIITIPYGQIPSVHSKPCYLPTYDSDRSKKTSIDRNEIELDL
jgi:lariat debranching enzyme